MSRGCADSFATASFAARFTGSVSGVSMNVSPLSEESSNASDATGGRPLPTLLSSLFFSTRGGGSSG
ncbi:MAG: hypothetical protein QM770_20670 [Tepidisphaeraceae bacterium]